MSNTVRPEIAAAVDAMLATAWEPPAVVTEEVLLKADAEARRFAREWSRLSPKDHAEAEVEEAIRPLMEHAQRLVEYLTAAPVQSATTAALSLRHILGDGMDEESSVGQGLDGSESTEFHLTGLARIQEWLEQQIDRDTLARERRAFMEETNKRIEARERGEGPLARPEVVAAVDAVLAAGWHEPDEGEPVTDETLIAAEREVERLWQERRRLFAELEQQGGYTGEDEDEIGRLWDRADELIDMALQAPVIGPDSAAAMLRILRREMLERELDDSRGLYAAAFERVLGVLEREER